jgi:hypothetical protein
MITWYDPVGYLILLQEHLRTDRYSFVPTQITHVPLVMIVVDAFGLNRHVPI